MDTREGKFLERAKFLLATTLAEGNAVHLLSASEHMLRGMYITFILFKFRAAAQ